jgi:hypothetical protein
MDGKKHIGMDVHKDSISIAVRNAAGKIAIECVIETKASMILQFIDGPGRDLHVTFEEGTWGLVVRSAQAARHGSLGV